MSEVTFIHLSDIHLRVGGAEEYNAGRIKKDLVDDITSWRRQHGSDGNLARIDMVLCTGDVAFSGAKKGDEYSLAEDFLEAIREAAGLERAGIFIIPGNHDIDRSSIMQKRHRPNFNSQDEVTGALTDRDWMSTILEPMENYCNFVNSYFDGVEEYIPIEPDNIFHVRCICVNGRKIAVACLNSAWLCSEENDKQPEKLWMGRFQADNAIQEAEDAKADYFIALTHHPFEWLHPTDRNDVEGVLSSKGTFKSRFLLHGHLHRPGVPWSHVDHCHIIGAGAIYDRSEKPAYPKRYLICVLRGNGLGSCWFRKYTDEGGGRWTSDEDYVGESTGGVKEWSYREVPTSVLEIVDCKTDIIDLISILRHQLTRGNIAGLTRDEIDQLKPYKFKELEGEFIGEVFNVIEDIHASTFHEEKRLADFDEVIPWIDILFKDHYRTLIDKHKEKVGANNPLSLTKLPITLAKAFVELYPITEECYSSYGVTGWVKI